MQANGFRQIADAKCYTAKLRAALIQSRNVSIRCVADGESAINRMISESRSSLSGDSSLRLPAEA